MSDTPNRQVSEFKVYDRTYVGAKETFAYLLNDFSNAFNIGQFTDRFIWDVVKIDFKTKKTSFPFLKCINFSFSSMKRRKLKKKLKH